MVFFDKLKKALIGTIHIMSHQSFIENQMEVCLAQ